MPITQERMLTCINAGLSAFNALELAKQIITEQIINIKNRSNSDTVFMLETLQILLMPETLVNTAGPMSYIEAWHQLQTEARHFREFKSTNLRAKRYQRRKRQNQPSNKQLQNHDEQPELTQPFYQQIQDQIKQQLKDKLDKIKNPQDTTIDFRNYEPEDFE